MLPNKGRMPKEAAGKRVAVTLRNGSVCGLEPVGNALPAGWAAHTTRWSLDGSPHDVVAYRIVE